MRSVLITGCRSGLGFALVKHILNNKDFGVDILIATCRSKHPAQALHDLAEEYNNLYVLELEITKWSSYPEFVSEVNNIVGDYGLNILIHNSGLFFSRVKTIEDVVGQELYLNFNVNTIGPILLTQSLLPLLRQGAEVNKSEPFGPKRAAIYYISSNLASIQGNVEGGYWGYRESKAATNMAFRSMSNELDRDGIAVMVVYPGLFASRVGGRKVKRTAEKSAKRVFRLMLKLDKRANGRFYGPKGRQLFW